MAAGDKEVRQAFQDMITRNMSATVEFTNKTRKMMIDAEKRIQNLEDKLIQKEGEVIELKATLSQIQSKLYMAGM